MVNELYQRFPVFASLAQIFNHPSNNGRLRPVDISLMNWVAVSWRTSINQRVVFCASSHFNAAGYFSHAVRTTSAKQIASSLLPGA